MPCSIEHKSKSPVTTGIDFILRNILRPLAASSLILVASSAFGLNAPTNLHTVGNDFSWQFSRQTVSIVIGWNDNTGLASSNLVQHSTDGGSTWSTIVTQPPGNSTAGEEIPIGLTYQYRVQSLYNGTSSAFTSAISISALEPPSQYVFFSTNTGTINIYFTANGTEAGANIPYCTNYALEVSTNGFSTFSTILIPNTIGANLNTNIIVSSNFLAGVTYSFQIRLVNSTNSTRSVVNERWGPISLAPNAVPPPPWHFKVYTVNQSDTGFNAPTVLEFKLDDNCLTETGFLVERSTDSNTWTTVTTASPILVAQPIEQSYYGPVQFVGGNSYYDDHNLSPGTNYFYRASATNSLGKSAFIVAVRRLPPIIPAGITNFFIDQISGSGGNNSGTNWASAWTTPETINWVALSAGSTVHIGGGDYTPGDIIASKSGQSGSPIIFMSSREAGHSGPLICHGGGIDANSNPYLVFEGRIDTNLTWIGLTPYNITNNINWHLLTNFGAAISCSSGANGFQLRGIEIRGAGFLYTNLGNVIPLGSKASGILLNADNFYTNAEIGFCYVHDATDYAFSPSFGQFKFGDFSVHDCVLANYNGGIMRGGSMDFYRNICGPTKYPGTEHGNGLACSPNNQRIYANIFWGINASYIYANTHGLNPNYNFFYYNNLAYMGPGFFQDAAGGFEFTCSEQTGFITFTNVIIANNTSYKVVDPSMVATANQGFGMTNWITANDLVLTPDDGNSSDTVYNMGSFPPSVSDNANNIFDFNLFGGPCRQIQYGAGLYADAIALNSGTVFKHNRTNSPAFVNATNWNFRLLTTDTNAFGFGTNLAALSAIAPGINLDMNGMPRGNSIGALGNLDPSLLYWGTFAQQSSITNSVNDDSGWTNTAFNLNTTNQVLLSTLPVSGLACGFWGKAYPDGFGFELGPYLAITNYTNFTILSNFTFSARTFWDTNSGFTSSILDWGFGENPPLGGASGRFFRNQDSRVYLTLWTNSTDINAIVFPDDTVGGGNLSQTNEAMLTVTGASDGTNLTCVGYYNGQPFETNTVGGVPFLSVDSLNHWVAVGCWHHNNPDTPTPPNGPNNGWAGGKMGDIRIYGRALSGGEVNAIYSSPQLVLGSAGSFSAPVSDPLITAQPQPQTVVAGQTATFTVTATGTATIHYYWTFNGSPVGTDSPTYARVNCQLGDNGLNSQVLVSNSVSSVLSSTATLTVTAASTTAASIGQSNIGKSNIGSP
jgi:hypothetical protein